MSYGHRAEPNDTDDAFAKELKVFLKEECTVTYSIEPSQMWSCSTYHFALEFIAWYCKRSQDLCPLTIEMVTENMKKIGFFPSSLEQYSGFVAYKC